MIKKIVKHIMSDLANGVVTRHPEKAVINDIIEKMRFVLFPEYFGNGGNLEYSLGHVLEEVFSSLRSQGVSEEVVNTFIAKIPILREYLLTDIDAAFDGDPAARSKAEIIISYPGIFAVMAQRVAHELYILDVPLIPRMMTEYAHSLTGIDIHPGATIGKYFFIDHGTGVVIGETTVIGNNVKIYQGVTLGALSTRDGQKLKSVKRHPTLEDYVTVYSGASIFGGETVIGSSVTIGSSSFITKSIPDRTRVSVKKPELQFKPSDKKYSENRITLGDDEFWDFEI